MNALVCVREVPFKVFFVWIQGYGMTERMTKPTPSPTSAEELDINFYMNKLRTIRANCGLENADVSSVLFTSRVLLCFGGFQNFCSKLLNLRSHVYTEFIFHLN